LRLEVGIETRTGRLHQPIGITLLHQVVH
jgi:hypothetical protein